MWRALAFTGFFLNLFNLIPVCRSTAGARWRRWLRGCGSSASRRWSAVAIFFHAPIMIAFLVFGGWDS